MFERGALLLVPFPFTDLRRPSDDPFLRSPLRTAVASHTAVPDFAAHDIPEGNTWLVAPLIRAICCTADVAEATVRIEFDWDPAKAVSNVAKHRVTFEEAMTVFRDPLARSILDCDEDEERWVTIGQASTGNLLLVAHSWVDINLDRCAVRIISARRPTRNEARPYREGSIS